MSIQKDISDFSFIIGKSLVYGGACILVPVAIITTVSIDFVMLHVAIDRNYLLLSDHVFGSMFSNPRNANPMPLLMISQLAFMISAILTVTLGLPPYIVFAIVAEFILADIIILAGFALIALSKAIDPAPEIIARTASLENSDGHINDNMISQLAFMISAILTVTLGLSPYIVFAIVAEFILADIILAGFALIALSRAIDPAPEIIARPVVATASPVVRASLEISDGHINYNMSYRR